MAFIKFKPVASIFYFISLEKNNEIKEEVKKYLLPDEEIVFSFKSQRDIGIFTDKRILLIDKKGLRGIRESVYSIMYESICFNVLNEKELDYVLEIFTNTSREVVIKFAKNIDISEMEEVYKFITNRALKF